jgi:hypothetical protein
MTKMIKAAPKTVKEIIYYLKYSIGYRVEIVNNEHLYIWGIDDSLIDFLKDAHPEYNIDYNFYMPILEQFIEFRNISQIETDYDSEFKIFESIYL